MKTILVADDSTIIQKSIDISLSQSDLNIIYASNAQETLDLIQQHQLDLFILDISLPDQNGFDLCAKIRSSPGHEETPVIMLGSAQSPFDLAHLQRVHAQDYILKPFETIELSEKVHGYLNHLSSPPTRDEESFFSPKTTPSTEHSQSQHSAASSSNHDIGFSSVDDIDLPASTEHNFDTNYGASAFDAPQPQQDIRDFAFDNSELTGINPDADLESISNPINDELHLDKHEESTDINYRRSKHNMNISEISADSYAHTDSSIEEQTSAYLKSNDALDMSLHAHPVETNIVDDHQFPKNTDEHSYLNSQTDIVYSDPMQKTTPEKDMDTAQNTAELKISDEQIESIVTKVFENVIERIAWEIVPDTAEKMIREEIDRLTKD